MKLIGLGPKIFIREKFNIFDMLIVIVSLIEIVISSGRGSFGALRAFRLLRIFKIFRVESLRILIDSIAFTLTTIGNYFILLLLFIYVYALLGMTFFADRFKFDPDTGLYSETGVVPKNNFDDVLTACRSVFAVMIGDNWNYDLYNSILTVGWASCIYYITLMMFGNIIMLNLFLAILLGNFD
jgi:Na+-transporting methylmalonyl-CoA/oxaloacetate decarboxylase gamma subunit